MIIQFDITGGQKAAIRSEMITFVMKVMNNVTVIHLSCGGSVGVHEDYDDVIAKICDADNTEDPNPCQVNQTEFKIHAD